MTERDSHARPLALVCGVRHGADPHYSVNLVVRVAPCTLRFGRMSIAARARRAKGRGKRGAMPDYDVALSFAGEDRAIARELALYLKARDVLVFYDDDAQAELLGEHLTEYLVELYRRRASYCVVLVSEHYVRKRWTRHEWRAAQTRAFEEFDRAYILPIRLDETELPGLLPTMGYLSLTEKSLSTIGDAIWTKVASTSETNKLYRQAEQAYNNGAYD